MSDLEHRLHAWLPEQRWFRAKSRHVARVRVVDTVSFGARDFVFVRVEYTGGESGDDYVLLLDENGKDVLGDVNVASELLAAFRGPALAGKGTTLRFEALPGLAKREGEAGATFTPKPVTTEQTNSSILYGNSFVLKILRQLDEGMSPDLEMGEFLTLAGYEHAPTLAGTIVVDRAEKEASTLGVLHRFVANQGDAWTFTLRELRAHLNGSESSYGARAELLGKRVGQMHVALASRADIPAFAPERLTETRRKHMVMAAKRALERAVAAVEKRRAVPELAKALPSIDARLERFATMSSDPVAMRVHGDLHLGQVLFTGDDFTIIDFEGEPARPLLDRKAKRSPFVDVAGMLRSFHYAAMTGLRENPAHADAARAWHAEARAAFLRGWQGATSTTPLLAMDEVALDFALLEKCIYEVNYEADNRPDWIEIPLEGLIARQEM